MSRFLLATLALLLLLGPAVAGPNQGGVLLVHCNPDVSVPQDPTFVDGELAACDSAVVQAPVDSTVLWFVYAAFPSDSSPRLKVATFGCEFDENQVGLLWWATRPGAMEIRYEEVANWPYTGSGTAIGFSETLIGTVEEVYCFAGYGPEGETFSVVTHPDQGGAFADDGSPSLLDQVAGYGTLGFGTVAGINPCFQTDEGDIGNDLPEDDGTPGDLPEGEQGDSGPPTCFRTDLTQLVFIQLNTTTSSQFVSAVKELRSDYGLHVLLALYPDGMFCRGYVEQLAAVREDPRVVRVAWETIPGVPALGSTLSPGAPVNTAQVSELRLQLSATRANLGRLPIQLRGQSGLLGCGVAGRHPTRL